MAELNMETALAAANIAVEAKPLYELAHAYQRVIDAVAAIDIGIVKNEAATVVFDETIATATKARDSAIRQCLKAAARHLNPRKARAAK